MIPLYMKTLMNSDNPIPNPLYKGVSKLRLKADLQEPALPIGIRPGSATVLAATQGGREPTELDKITLWFGEKSRAKDYCRKHSASILLRIDLSGYNITRSGSDFYTTEPIPWDRVTYLKSYDTYGSLRQGQTLPTDAKEIKEDDDSEESW